MTQDRPVIGVLLMLGFCIVAPMADSLAKLLGPHVGVWQLVLLRFGVQVALLWPLVWLGRRPWRMDARVLGFVALRTGLHICGIALMFSALLYLPLAEAIAIAFVMPFLMLLLGWLVLGEEVGPWRLGACAVGFGGTLMVVQPTFRDVGWPALLPLGVAVVFALFMLVTRRIAKQTDPVAMQAVSGVMALVVLAPVLLLGQAMPLNLALPQWQGLSGSTLWMVLAMGSLGTVGHLLMTWSLRFAPSATLAPMQYLEIPFATLIGWLVFRDLPDGLALAGICVTIAAGLFILLRERATARRAATSPVAPGPAPPAAE